VVLDEAQSIKNPRTLVAHAAWGLHADHRWCLSGTPIQNTIDDLYSYFKFLRYRFETVLQVMQLVLSV
jgi:SNF2 family DNA or RNA helicase